MSCRARSARGSGISCPVEPSGRFRKRVDYSEYGGAPLLGVGGLCIIGHGRSSAKAVRNAVAMAYRFASQDFVRTIAREISELSVPQA